MASPIVECQKQRDDALKALAKIRANGERQALHHLESMDAKDAEILFLRMVIARKELQKSMITSLFDRAVENAGTVGELRSWWGKFLREANGIDAERDDWDAQAMKVTEDAGIAWSKESIQRNMQELLAEYGVTHQASGLVFGRAKEVV